MILITGIVNLQRFNVPRTIFSRLFHNRLDNEMKIFSLGKNHLIVLQRKNRKT